MTTGRKQRAKEIFDEVRATPPQGRAAVLSNRCGGDPALRQLVESFLSMDAHSTAMYAPDESAPSPADAPGRRRALEKGDPSRIGPYRILDVLGEGGFGMVYLAEQEEPLRRRVALKIIKPGMDSRQVLARFEAERHALSVMDHPGIAKVLDAGVTGSASEAGPGRPYFVMEHVPGEPITSYCDRHMLSVRERLDVMLAVCDAVQHAHMKGIIHRDLKPSNVLVMVRQHQSGGGGPEAVPKVIDFGVAKALHGHLGGGATIHTEQGHLIGTPEYMSPEQAEMTALDIDTRADVYSLGVMLYELVTGVLPFEPRTLREGGLAEIQRIIRQVEPARPSARLAALGAAAQEPARHRRLGAEPLARLLRVELEWIPLKAIEKDRTRRYQSALQMGDDIRNYLAARPLLAGPPGAGYRVRKFVRRHRVGVATGAAIVLAVMAGIAGTTWGLLRAGAQARNAAIHAGRSERTSSFLRELLDAVDPRVAQGMDTALLRQILDTAGARLDKESALDPEVEAPLRITLGTTYTAIGVYDRAEQHLQRALERARAAYGDRGETVADALSALGRVMLERERHTEARGHIAHALALRRAAPNPRYRGITDDLQNLGLVARRLGDLNAAKASLEEALDLDLRRAPAGSEDYLIRANLSAVLLALGLEDDARQRAAEALSLLRERAAPGNPDIGHGLMQWGEVLLAHGWAREAEQMFAQALAVFTRAYPDDHMLVAAAMHNVGAAQYKQGRYAEAATNLAGALERWRKVGGTGQQRYLEALMTLIAVRRAETNLREVETLQREAAQIIRKLPGAAAAGTRENLVRLLNESAITRFYLGDPAGAADAFREALALRVEMGQGDTPNAATLRLNLASMLVEAGQWAEARALAEKALARFEQLTGPEYLVKSADSLRVLGLADTLAGRPEEGLAHLERAVTLLDDPLVPGAEAWRAGRAESSLGQCLAALKRYDEAEPKLLHGYERLREARGADFAETRIAARRLAAMYEARGEPEKSARWQAAADAPDAGSSGR